MRFLLSLIAALLVGLLIGVYLGWVQYPVEFTDSPARGLAQRYKDEYTVMIATGYRIDHDLAGAAERLRVLGVNNAPDHVREVTERSIANSREVEDIRHLVALAEAFNRLTPVMEPYRQVTLPGQGS